MEGTLSSIQGSAYKSAIIVQMELLPAQKLFKKPLSIPSVFNKQLECEVESFSGLGLKPNRNVSQDTISTLLASRKFIKLDNVPRMVISETKLNQDWVTIGVLVQKGAPKVAKNGENYLTLCIGDLEGKDLLIIAFQDAFNKWKDEPRGSVLGILNAKPSSKSSRSYSIHSAGQMLKIGESFHFGICKGTDPKQCKQYINTKYTRYCGRHNILKPKSLVRRLELTANQLPSKYAPKYMPEVAEDNFAPPRPEEVDALDNYLKLRKLLAQDSRKPVTIELDYPVKRKREEEAGDHKRSKLM
mmetsp:Transcript_7926/g.15385  ORF Transcript_7926/g.15385 Transcript_7926/m.15385 type:complete len:300 (-) Transcript_7926:1075-1974(-)